MDLALNNLQWLICHKTQQTKPTSHQFFTLSTGLLNMLTAPLQRSKGLHQQVFEA